MINDFQEFFILFFRPVVFIGLVFLIVSVLFLHFMTMVRAVDEA